MPTRLLEPYVLMAPRIEAQRAMLAAEQIAVGVGRLPAQAHRETVARWRRALGSSRSAQRPRTPEELAVMARAAGIGFRRVVKSDG